MSVRYIHQNLPQEVRFTRKLFVFLHAEVPVECILLELHKSIRLISYYYYYGNG